MFVLCCPHPRVLVFKPPLDSGEATRAVHADAANHHTQIDTLEAEGV